MARVFISYRRADSIAITGRIHDRLLSEFGRENVFQDVDNIPRGVNFKTFLENEVQACDVLLVIIGPRWVSVTDEHGQRRLDNPADFVRIEVESGLVLGKLVIPVLVDGARMPGAGELPETMTDLAFINAAVVRHNPDFHRDMTDLIADIHRLVQPADAPPVVEVVHDEADPPPPPAPTKPRSIDLLPAPFAWIEIPGGRGTLKTDEKNVTLPIPTETYWIGKYPVTNAQFAQFIEAGGYENDTWWTEAGWKAREEGWHYADGKSRPSGKPWTQPRYWQNSKWNGDEYPVVGVSWYEAVAFCLWLSDATGEHVMLPTEQQWQRAAQGDTGWDYPYGNKFDATKSNTHKSGITRTTPVTNYEGKGDSPFGVVDMSGNVWEWCATDWDSGSQDVHSVATRRVLRGGSWVDPVSNARCVSRYISIPHLRVDYRGFRVVCGAAPILNH